MIKLKRTIKIKKLGETKEKEAICEIINVFEVKETGGKMPQIVKDELIESLAAIEHTRWANWQSYLHSMCIKNEDGSLTISKDLVNRWNRQIKTSYAKLSEKEKKSDRKEVCKTLTEIRKTHIIIEIED